ncbi:MAG: hypothetical protein QOC82_1325 [Frankiaceae bacterium]|jgi:hypothetical protein|nr:hypothetical protein [Frankiaceae bacterium]
MRHARKVCRTLVALTVAAGTVGFMAQPASAEASGVIEGTLTYDQGLTAAVAPQGFRLVGNAVVQAPIPGTGGCTITANDDIASVKQGSGTYDGICDTSDGEAWLSGRFSRTATELRLSGTVLEDPQFGGTFDGRCQLAPLPEVGPPATFALSQTLRTFEAACVFTIT